MTPVGNKDIINQNKHTAGVTEHKVITEDKVTIAEAFNRFSFPSVFTFGEAEMAQFMSHNLPEWDRLQLTYEGTVASLLKMYTSKAAGLYKISNLFFKSYVEWMARYLFIIFKKSLITGMLPSDCKISKNKIVLRMKTFLMVPILDP